MRYFVKKSTVYKVSIELPFEKKGQNYGSLPRSWVQYHLLKIVRDGLHFINKLPEPD